MITYRYFSEAEKEIARKNTFVLIGVTGKGKSQIIKFLTGDSNVKVSNSKTSCTQCSNLYYASVPNGANNEELFCVVDTAGLCDSSGREQDNKNYNDIKNILLNNKCEVKGIFIVEDFQTERLDGEQRKVIKAASDLFPLKKFWSYTTFIFTHYYNKGTTRKVKIKNEQIGPFCDSLENIMEQIKERIPTIDSADVNSINKLYINIDNNVIEKDFDLNDEDEKESYEQGLKDLEKAKNELHTEIFKKIKLEPLYDEVIDCGNKRFIIRKEADALNYDIYEVYMEIRNFYLKGKLIFTDFIYVKSPEFIEKVNKAMFYINKVKNGIVFAGAVINTPIIKGIALFYDQEIEIIPTLGRIFDQLFPDETDKEYRTKLY